MEIRLGNDYCGAGEAAGEMVTRATKTPVVSIVKKSWQDWGDADDVWIRNYTSFVSPTEKYEQSGW